MKTIWKFLITVLVGLAGVAGFLYSRDFLEVAALSQKLHILCDAFFVVGVVLTSVGLLVFTTNEGAFDMIVYGMRSFIDLFKKNNTRKYETYYDYRVARSEKKLKFGFLLICGLVFLATSVVLFYCYKQYI